MSKDIKIHYLKGTHLDYNNKLNQISLCGKVINDENNITDDFDVIHDKNVCKTCNRLMENIGKKVEQEKTDYYCCICEATDKKYFKLKNNLCDDCINDGWINQTKQIKEKSIVETKPELSACGKTYSEFMAACNDDCSNVLIVHGEDSKETSRTACSTLSNLRYNISLSGLKNYSIKSIPPKEQKEIDVWNEDTIKEAGFNAGDSLYIDPDNPESLTNIKPNQYTINENQMTEIEKILEQGINPRVVFSNVMREMKDKAWDIKEMSLFELSNIINKIKDN